jgi:hypothetical protein
MERFCQEVIIIFYIKNPINTNYINKNSKIVIFRWKNIIILNIKIYTLLKNHPSL